MLRSSLSVLLLIQFVACESTPERKQEDEPAKAAAVIGQPKVKATKEERQEEAKNLLMSAGNAETKCDSLNLYKTILDEYSDLREAKFARKAVDRIDADLLNQLRTLDALYKKAARQNLLSEQKLNEAIKEHEERDANCETPAINGAYSRMINFLKDHRAKIYGY